MDQLLRQAVAFHGHLGPHLVLGLRMGLLAKNLLNGTPFTMRAEIHTQTTPPLSCILDGIQVSSGCTLGKGNITVKEDRTIYGIFLTDSRKIKISVKKEILNLIREPPEESAQLLAAKKDEELFDVVS